MRLNLAPVLVATLSLIASDAWSQTQAERMTAAARQLRDTAEQHKATLAPEARAEMLRQADEMEKGVRAGAHVAYDALPEPPSLAEALMGEHGQLEWLTPNGACAGYTLANFDRFRFSPQINDRDTHCRNAYGHYAAYLRRALDPAGAEDAAQSLFYYDAAARRAAGMPRRAVR
ncbi:hypothetical protein [Phenylobacterium sp.]|uniref:hypothetical protein n=1 Tax=Phenylobacterium sp. TaxID=1871053 RepID=UPI00301DD1DC